MNASGTAAINDRLTSADLARLAGMLGVGQPFQGRVTIAGAKRPVVAVAANAGDSGALLVLIRADGAEEVTSEALEIVTRVWSLVAGRLDERLEEARPTDLSASRIAAGERARVAAELAHEHGAVLSALLGTLRATKLGDGAARRAATDLAASALVELRSSAERERELGDEPVGSAFERLRDELGPLVRYSSAELELVTPEGDRMLPAPIVQAARAIVRGAVLNMLEQEAVGRIRVGWQVGVDLVVSVLDDGPGALAGDALAAQTLRDRAEAVDGRLEIESVPGWGTRLSARLPLGPAAETVDADPLARLHPRELEVLGQLARGQRNRQIAETLEISENTVKFHVTNVLSKLGAHSRGEAAAIAHAAGLEAPRAAALS
jgi:DNA-binding CsgD family transcriptional regulator